MKGEMHRFDVTMATTALALFLLDPPHLLQPKQQLSRCQRSRGSSLCHEDALVRLL